MSDKYFDFAEAFDVMMAAEAKMIERGQIKNFICPLLCHCITYTVKSLLSEKPDEMISAERIQILICKTMHATVKLGNLYEFLFAL
jgi:hypothetical protein